MASRMITLFNEPSLSNRGPSTLVLSLFFHGVMLGSITAGVLRQPTVYARYPRSIYSLKVLELEREQAMQRRSVGSGIFYPGPRSLAKAAPASGGAAEAAPPPSAQVAQIHPAPQTLIQPDLPEKILPEKIAVPSVVLWSPEVVPAHRIVPPAPKPATIADVRPVIEQPNRQLNLADARIAPSVFQTEKLAVLPSTTSPVVVHGPEAVKKVPETSAKSTQPPTPARVLSLSETHVPDGPVALPQVNETASKPATKSLTAGNGKNPAATASTSSPAKNPAATASAKPGAKTDSPAAKADSKAQPSVEIAGTHPNPNGKSNATGTGRPAADPPNASAAPGSVQASVAQSGANTGAIHGADNGAQTGSPFVLQRIHLPVDGHFGVVVVGESIEDRYPETAELWSGRLAATVYVRVGKGKSWILQYANPKDGETAGTGRLEAPWPYDIAVPNVNAKDLDSDALIVHGFVNADGRFEKLRVAFPPQFPQSPMLINVLSQWQFRPGSQNGKNIPLEVLLIIPEGTED